MMLYPLACTSSSKASVSLKINMCLRRRKVPKSDKEKIFKEVEVNEEWVEVETIQLNTQDRNTILSVTGCGR